MIVVCILIALIATLLWYKNALQAVNPNNTKTVDITVQSGESVRDVAVDLKQHGLIKSDNAFLWYYRNHRSGSGVQAGKYAIAPSMTPATIVQMLTHGKVIQNTITVTIPEGYNVNDIAARLQQKGVCSKTAFLNEVQHGTFTEPFLNQLKGRKNIRYRLEGYLFPDTYQFEPHQSAHDVVNRMLLDFQNRVMTKQTEAALSAQHMTLNHLITEASIVQNEARVNKERPIIASVINNRLHLGMKLQVDATVEYAIGHHISVVTDADTRINSPFNTYVVTGLPPGPIDAPGLKSIEAVLHPAHTEYVYYVAKGDGSGEHYFSRTYQEQLHNEALRAQNLQKAGK